MQDDVCAELKTFLFHLLKEDSMCLPEPIVGQYANIQVGCGNLKPPVQLKLDGLFSEGGDSMCVV